MNNKFRLFNVAVVLTLAITLALGVISPVSATTNYSVIGWGDNIAGQSEIPSGLTDVIAISAGGYYSLALKGDGTVVAWGDNSYGQTNVPPGLTDVIAISAGLYHSLALKSDGTVVSWGYNFYGETNVPPGLTDVIAVSAGEFHSLALKSDGSIAAWGMNWHGQLDTPADLTDVVAISTGGYTNFALKSDGTIVGWGWSGYNALDIPVGLTNVVAISASREHNLALKDDGTVVGWGLNVYGSLDFLPSLTDVVAISAGLYHNLALKSDGTVVGWGCNYDGQSSVPADLPGTTAIAAGGFHSLALVISIPPTNTSPTANPGGPYLGAVNTSIAFDGSLSSDPEDDSLSFAWDFGDSATAAGSTPAHTYTAPGIYNVCLTVNDGTLDSEPACTLAVVYDPSAGFVTGGGWINSPARAFKADESLTGRATFGFMAKYQKGTTIPTGNTAFQFDLAGLAFASQNYEWLVVNQGGMNAQFKGSGLINGAADANGNLYKFMLWAADGSPDTFRIRIWWEDGAGEHDVYDNGVAQAIGGGNIVVHTGK